MAESTPEERRKRRVEEAKRRAAEKRGDTFVSEADKAVDAPTAESAGDSVAGSEMEQVTQDSTSATATANGQQEETGASEKFSKGEAADMARPAAEVGNALSTQASEQNGGVAARAGAQAAPQTRSVTKDPDEKEEETKFLRTDIRTMNRREFLTYSWGAAAGIVTAQSLVATGLLMYPRFRAGEFGGDFMLGSAESLPGIESAPQGDPIGKFWLVNTEEGPRALYMVCTHLGCLYKWVQANERFECPCHGSKFTREGIYIEGPAPRGLDQFVVELQDNGAVVSTTESRDGEIQPPVANSEGLEIVIKTGSKIQGKSKA